MPLGQAAGRFELRRLPVAITPIDDTHVELLVQPGLGVQCRRRLFGCLEDATLDLVQARVTGWHDRG